eukprot:CAMPEP_0173176858 /NCGR_PEP_ID=MMETSP1141-20130122/4688_1 /TAXON_ID=483371 /ORGANISM="non described non described, Strain CCMP2298" /LENGTH=467 /DNA_ID=CAMNT_0014099233 /DNA_START=3 /DNA_END=1410 /DNA_ORIENTATION=+
MIGDGSRLGQVLRNLLSNAIKFTNAGGTVTVIVERVPGGMPGHVHIVLPEEQRGLLSYPRAGSVRISVVDSGAGLSEQQLLDIGQEGLQFNASALQGGGGSGLGIFISKGLVLQHGGLMTVTSPGLGRGVSTTLEFPLFEAVVDDDEFPQPLADTEQQQAEVGALGPGEDYLRDYRIQAAPVVKLGAGASRGSAYLLPEAGQDIPPSIKIPVTLAVTPAASASEIEISSLSRSASPITTPFMSVKIPAFGSASTSPSASALSVVSPSHAPPKRYMLVVDDATSNRKLLVRIFKIKGFVCQEACDGQVALQKYADMCAQGTPPAAILMDFEMPVLNGPSATRLLREQGCSSFILGVTGNVMKADMDYFKSCGADAVFAKPLTSESVGKVMARIAMPRAEAPAIDESIRPRTDKAAAAAWAIYDLLKSVARDVTTSTDAAVNDLITLRAKTRRGNGDGGMWDPVDICEY